GRGYVLRRLIRRAIRHGHKLGAHETFFYKLVGPLCEQMGDAYPELNQQRPQVERVLQQEEDRFNETLDQGLRILENDIAALKGNTISGSIIFKLYDTYGFPADLTRDIALERNLKLDMPGFEREMEAQRERARAASSFKSADLGAVAADKPTQFTGYERLSDAGKILQITRGGSLTQTDHLNAGEQGNIVLDHTPFYAESGGQAGDRGVLRAGAAIFRVEDTQKHGQIHVHKGRVENGQFRVSETVTAEVDVALRRATVLNHSATHLMHKALRDVLGSHVQQKGSLVDAAKTRFDFSHNVPMTPEQIAEVERRVNEQILSNEDTRARVMDMDSARAEGAMALFGEKYGSEVRVLNIGDSIELCGGTHVRRTGDIGLFKIVSEGGVASGVRRIEAITGPGALAYLYERENKLRQAAEMLRASPEEVPRKIEQLTQRLKSLEKELDQLRGKLAAGGSKDLAAEAKEVKGIKVLAARLDDVDAKGLRDAMDRLKDKLAPAAIVLAAVADNKVSLIAGVTKELVGRLHAGELINQVAVRVGGKGGGRPDMAQAGGTDPSGLDAALADVPGWVEQQLK
ncbi:MAG TPA: alanine--tRNA ligase, partial [Burkholderiales bacterium]|nr:alanine--tRNA ligase [Burkholderiales bacterium]